MTPSSNSITPTNLQTISADDPLFSICPENVLFEVLRKMSGHPQLTNWPAHLDPFLLLRLCESAGDLGAIARRSVPALEVPRSGFYFDGEVYKPYIDNMNANQLDRQALSVRVSDKSQLDMCKRLLKLVGPSLNRLTLSYSHIWTENADIAGVFTNLESLVLYDKYTEFDLPALLNASSGKLRSLDLQGDFLPRRYIDAIATYCRGLETIGLKFGEIGASMDRLWECVGPSLRELVFGRPARVDQHEYPECTFLNYGDMHKHCVELDTLEIQDIGFGTMPVSAIKGFGWRLRTLRMTSHKSCLEPAKLGMILNSCRPDIAVHTYVQSRRAETMKVLSNRARVLKLKYDTFDEDLEQACIQCTEIRELTAEVLSDYVESFLRSFFITPKYKLRKMNITVEGYLKPDTDGNMFEKIAVRVDSIENLTCTVDNVSEGAFKKFAETNRDIQCVRVTCSRSSLTYRTSSLDEKDDHFKAEKAAASFLSAFSTSEKLTKLVLNDKLLDKKSEKLEAILQQSNMIGRCIDVHVGGIQYNCAFR